MPRFLRLAFAVLAAAALLSGPAAAQDMTGSDLNRLQRTVDQLAADIVELRQRDRAAARALRAELDDLEEEVIYLKVKQRREGVVTRADYTDVRDRLENLRARVHGDATGRYGATGSGRGNRAPSTAPRATDPGVVPEGTELDVRLEQRLSSETAEVEDRFEATTVVPLRQNGRVIIPEGARVRGVVTGVQDAGRFERKGELQLSFDQITFNGRTYPIRGTVTEALQAGGYREDAEKIGAGAAVGAIIGGILGGVRGAITGVLIGGGGVVAATEGQDVVLPSGTILRMRLDQDLNVANALRR